MTAFSNKRYSGRHKAAEEEDHRETPGKETWRGKCGQHALGSAGGRWRQQHKTGPQFRIQIYGCHPQRRLYAVVFWTQVKPQMEVNVSLKRTQTDHKPMHFRFRFRLGHAMSNKERITSGGVVRSRCQRFVKFEPISIMSYANYRRTDITPRSISHRSTYDAVLRMCALKNYCSTITLYRNTIISIVRD